VSSILNATHHHVEARKDDLVNDTRLCESTIKGSLSAIRSLHRHIDIKVGDVPQQMDLQKLSQITVEKTQEIPDGINRTPLSKSEMRSLIENATPGRNTLMIRLAYQCALRNSEVRTAKIAGFEYDQEGATIEITDAKKNRLFEIPLQSDLAFQLHRWINTGRKQWSTAGRSEYIFPSERDDRLMSNAGFEAIVYKAAEDAELQDYESTPNVDYRTVTPHVLRHTGISHWRSSNLPRKFGKRIARHASNVYDDYGNNKSACFEAYREDVDLV
jgi:integrase